MYFLMVLKASFMEASTLQLNYMTSISDLTNLKFNVICNLPVSLNTNFIFPAKSKKFSWTFVKILQE